MTTTYTSVFGTDAVPPSDYTYAAVALTANTTFEWPQLATSANLIADLMEVTPSAASTWTLTMPAANQVSAAMPVVMRNMGADTFTVAKSTGATITTIAAGASKLIYITDNSTAAGTWASFTYGTGTSSADAATLAGYGTKATSGTLSTKFLVSEKSGNWSIGVADRATSFYVTSGSITAALPAVGTAGSDFFCLIRNGGSGSVTVQPDGSELIDGASSLVLAPDESAFVLCSGTYWYTVGYGRSTEFQFTKLVKDVTAGGSFTLTSAEASNKLLQFTGTPASNVTIIVPNVVSVYYTQNSYTGATKTVTIKTAAGASVVTDASTRAIVYCDGTDVVLAQTSTAPASTLTGGVAGAIVYQSAVDTTGFSAAGATGALVISGGTGAPTFSAVGATTEVLVGGGVGITPVWTTATGSGAPVRATSPTLVTPTLGVASATSVNKVAITAPATSATLTVIDGTTLTGPASSATLAGLGITETFTAPQRGTITTDNDGSFDLNVTNHFKCTPTGGFALTFTNIPSGQSGTIILINGSNYAITAAANTKVSSTALATISATGTYLLSYFTDGTDVYVASTGALA